MNTSTPDTSAASHLAALCALTAQQDYPAGCLYVVATPIGNIADIGLRALHTLALADTIACEDTRHSKTLLHRFGIGKMASQWLALHEHNEIDASQTVLDRLAKGERVAYISDAGTPAVSDPGARLVGLVHQAGYRTIPLPGASTVTTLLCASGAYAAQGESGFVFQGFLPHENKARKAALLALADRLQPVVLLEAPHRIGTLAKELQPFGSRTLTVGRELTKQFEEIANLRCQDFIDWLGESPHRLKGEYSLVLHPPSAPLARSDDAVLRPEAQRVLHILLDAGLGTKQAAKLAADITGLAKNTLYAAALSHASHLQNSSTI